MKSVDFNPRVSTEINGAAELFIKPNKWYEESRFVGIHWIIS